jgi:CheY-like chemotaxis protein
MTDTNDARLRGVQVLVVDDNEDTRVLRSVFLQHHGARVVAARTGAEALAAFAEVGAAV